MQTGDLYTAATEILVYRAFHNFSVTNVRGVFVVFEGIDGSGKSTTVSEIQGRLAERGIRSVVLREPTGKTDASREIRRILRTATEINDSVSHELLDLFMIDRLWDIRTQITPALQTGDVVLLDRYYLSTAAYQAEDTVTTRKIMGDYFSASQILKPDMLVYLDLPVHEAISRLGARENKDVFETESRLTQIAGRYAEAVRLFHEQFPKTPLVVRKDALRAEDYAALTEQICEIRQKGIH